MMSFHKINTKFSPPQIQFQIMHYIDNHMLPVPKTILQENQSLQNKGLMTQKNH
jgi:hypothetical protein